MFRNATLKETNFVIVSSYTLSTKNGLELLRAIFYFIAFLSNTAISNP